MLTHITTAPHLVVYWMEERVLWSPGKIPISPKIVKTIREVPASLFSMRKKEGPGGSRMVVTNGCAALAMFTGFMFLSNGLDFSNSRLKVPEDKSR